MTRERLPNRRRQLTEPVRWQEVELILSVGLYADGRIGEVFLKGAKSGSHLDSLMDDLAVLISRLLQHGDSLAEIRAGLGSGPGRTDNKTMITFVIDALDRIENGDATTVPA